MRVSFEKRDNYTISPMAVSRRTIFDLLKIVHSVTVPGFLICDFDMTWAEAFRAKLRERGEKITVTSIFLKAIGIAQQSHPMSRTEVLPFGRLVTYEDIVAGFTVERMINGQPTVFLGEVSDPHTKSIVEIAEELKAYGNSSIDSIRPLYLQNAFSKLSWFLRSIALHLGRSFPNLRLKCQRATSGLTSLGKLEIDTIFSPCLCTSTFGIGSVDDRVVVRNNRLDVRKTMTVSLSFNMMAMDSLNASRFVFEVRRLMEGGLEQWIETYPEIEKSDHSRQLVAV
ncbi:MAG: 2-oxo acid dehydrogenase subunit E2 [Candidatus Obscuribacterales bacterium]|nr:2-oxo acid dehydrogenase subunit E2 [Candidatus Obscuribacterales bacterium]